MFFLLSVHKNTGSKCCKSEKWTSSCTFLYSSLLKKNCVVRKKNRKTANCIVFHSFWWKRRQNSAWDKMYAWPCKTKQILHQQFTILSLPISYEISIVPCKLRAFYGLPKKKKKSIKQTNKQTKNILNLSQLSTFQEHSTCKVSTGHWRIWLSSFHIIKTKRNELSLDKWTWHQNRHKNLPHVLTMVMHDICQHSSSSWGKTSPSDQTSSLKSSAIVHPQLEFLEINKSIWNNEVKSTIPRANTLTAAASSMFFT